MTDQSSFNFHPFFHSFFHEFFLSRQQLLLLLLLLIPQGDTYPLYLHLQITTTTARRSMCVGGVTEFYE